MKTKNMKIKRNIILGAMIPIMFFSVAKIANADVYHVGFSNNTGSVTMTLTVEYALDKLTYSPGENITPRIETADRGDIRIVDNPGSRFIADTHCRSESIRIHILVTDHTI